MKRCHLLCHLLAVIVAALAFSGQAHADGGLPASQLDIAFLFMNLDKYPDRDFYLKYERGSLNPNDRRSHVTKVLPDTLTRLEGRGSQLGEIFLIAVPRGQEVALPEKMLDKNKFWLHNPPPGGLQSAQLKADTGLLNGYDITFHGKIDGNHLEVNWVESNLNAWWFTAELIAGLVAAACVLIPIAFIVLVVWLIARSRRSAK